MREEPIKQLGMSGPMYYVNMEFTKKGGRFTIDDKSGWYWSGDYDNFLTGLIRVYKSKMFEDFNKELAESNIKKSDIKRAIITSLNKDKKDGLYALLGDNRVYNGFDDLTDSLWSDESSEIESCLKKNGVGEEVSKDIADEIVSSGANNLKGSHEIFEEYETELSKDFMDKKKPWKDVMKGIVNACEKDEKSVVGFVKCIGDATAEFNLDDPEAQFERESEAWHSRYRVTDKSLKEISEKHGIPVKTLDTCAHGG